MVCVCSCLSAAWLSWSLCWLRFVMMSAPRCCARSAECCAKASLSLVERSEACMPARRGRWSPGPLDSRLEHETRDSSRAFLPRAMDALPADFFQQNPTTNEQSDLQELIQLAENTKQGDLDYIDQGPENTIQALAEQVSLVKNVDKLQDRWTAIKATKLQDAQPLKKDTQIKHSTNAQEIDAQHSSSSDDEEGDDDFSVDWRAKGY